MGDVFREQIVKRKSGARETAIKAGLIFVVVLIGAASSMVLGEFFVIITAAAGFGAYYLMSFLNLEYEYSFTNGELDIDVIYSKQRRKRLMSVNVKDIELMAHIDDNAHQHTFSHAQQVKDVSSGTPGPDTYVFAMPLGGKRTKVIFEPNEKMLAAIAKSMNRSKLHLRPGVVLI
jgi:hypothetical protein